MPVEEARHFSAPLAGEFGKETSSEASQACNESASYFSDKCRQCGFGCLESAAAKLPKEYQPDRKFRFMNIIGWGGIAVASVVLFDGHSHLASVLTILGAGAILTSMFRE